MCARKSTDDTDFTKSIKHGLHKLGTTALQIAEEVSEDCDNEILQNARDYYASGFVRVRNGLKAGMKAAEDNCDDNEETDNLIEDLSDTAAQLGSVIQEAAADCDNDVLKNAREFYSDAVRSACNKTGARMEEVRIRSEARKRSRAEAKRRRVALRKKLTGKTAVILLCLILVASLLISAALWVSRHMSTGNKNSIPEYNDNKPSAETSLLTESLGGHENRRASLLTI